MKKYIDCLNGTWSKLNELPKLNRAKIALFNEPFRRYLYVYYGYIKQLNNYDIHIIKTELLYFSCYFGLIKVLKYFDKRGIDIYSKVVWNWLKDNNQFEIIKYLILNKKYLNSYDFYHYIKSCCIYYIMKDIKFIKKLIIKFNYLLTKTIRLLYNIILFAKHNEAQCIKLFKLCLINNIKLTNYVYDMFDYKKGNLKIFRFITKYTKYKYPTKTNLIYKKNNIILYI
jgi:hypothetical protein